MMTAGDLLHRLLAVTPEPPPESTPELVLAAWARTSADRADILAELPTTPLGLTPAERALATLLERRHAAWHEALAAAQRAIGVARVGAGQLRAYAGAR